MNNKIFRIILMFLAVCISSISTLFAVSFGLSNVTLDHENQDLTQENEALNDAVSDLQNTINMDPASAVVSYEVDGKIWKIDVTKKGNSVSLPTAPDTDTHVFDGWKIDGVGENLKANSNKSITENTKFVANMVEKDWLKVNMHDGIANELYGNAIWTDGENYYHSSGNNHYVLKENNTWEKITWNGLTSFWGDSIWKNGTNIYYSSGSNHYVLHENNTWEKITWNGLTSFDGYYVWTDGTRTYYSNGSNQYVLNGDTWEKVSWNNLTSFDGKNVWTDGTQIYYNGEYVLGANNTWETTSLGLDITGEGIVVIGKQVYYVDKNGQYLWQADGTWKQIATLKTGSWYGFGAWTDGTNLYYSYNAQQFVYDAVNNLWKPMAWYGWNTSTLDAQYIWTDGTSYYYSYERQHYVFDVATHKWHGKVWYGLDDVTYFYGYNVWTDGTKNYFSYDNITQYVLNGDTWEPMVWAGDYLPYNGKKVWTDGENTYYSYSNSQYILGEDNTWTKVTWNGFTYIDGELVWTDGEKYYYSNSSEQYVLGEDNTWEKVTWKGLTEFYGYHIWTDGENIYRGIAGTGNKDYVLDKATMTWTEKVWYGYKYEGGQRCWQIGDDIYMIESTDQYILNKNKK